MKQTDTVNVYQTLLANDIDATDGNAKYDTQVKKVLANKTILAWILKYAMKEFAEMEISDIVKCIEGNVDVGTIPVEPGYDLVTRAIFYCARLLSAQLEQEFTNKTADKRKYDGIKKVYSIWICLDSQVNARDSIVEYHMVPNILYDGSKGRIMREHRYDLLSVVMINLGGDSMISKHELVNMLTTLLSADITKEDKKKKLQDTYNIPMTIKLEQEVDGMCNLSGYVERKGEENIIKLFTWLQNIGRTKEANEMMKLENEELRSRLWIEYLESIK